MQHSPKLNGALERTIQLIKERGGLPKKKSAQLDRYMQQRVGEKLWDKFKLDPSVENSEAVFKKLIRTQFKNKNVFDTLTEIVEVSFAVLYFWITGNPILDYYGAPYEPSITATSIYSLSAFGLSLIFYFMSKITTGPLAATIASIFGSGIAVIAGQLLIATLVLFAFIDALKPEHWGEGVGTVFEKLKYWLFGIERSWIEENASGKLSSRKGYNFFSNAYTKVTSFFA